MQIIGGEVSFKRSYQPEQYGSKGADVKISFSLVEGEDLGNSLDRVGVLVKAKVLELCNIKTEAAGNLPADVKAMTGKTAEQVVEEKYGLSAAEKAKLEGTLDADKIAANEAADAAAKAAKAAAKKAAKEAAAADRLGDVGDKKPLGDEPIDGSLPPGLKRTTEPEKAAVAADGEDIFDEDAAAAQVEITDQALSSAMNRKVGVLKDKHQGAAPKLIKELINKFVEPPKKAHDIPQQLRSDFLKKLEALT